MSNRNILLASTSRHRRALLERAGLGAVTSVAPQCDEEVGAGIAPVDLVTSLAERKARSVASSHPESLIIGADQVVELDGVVLGKPGTAERALEQLLSLSGREHKLLTGICVYDPSTDRCEVGVDVHRMHMWPLDERRLRNYIVYDNPLDCAGSYRVESAGVALFRAMEGEDYTAIVGLPICRLAELLARFEITLVDLIA